MGLSMKAVARFSLFPVLNYNRFLTWLGIRQWAHRVEDCVILGALPTRSLFRQLQEQYNFKAILAVTEPFELKLTPTDTELESAGIDRLHLDVVDLTAPSLEQIHSGADFLLRQTAAGRTVYVHCRSGRSRSSTLVAAYMAQKYGLTAKEANDRLTAIRPIVHIRKAQMEALETFCSSLPVKPPSLKSSRSNARSFHSHALQMHQSLSLDSMKLYDNNVPFQRIEAPIKVTDASKVRNRKSEDKRKSSVKSESHIKHESNDDLCNASLNSHGNREGDPHPNRVDENLPRVTVSDITGYSMRDCGITPEAPEKDGEASIPHFDPEASNASAIPKDTNSDCVDVDQGPQNVKT